ncbi:hypothetical protein SF148580_4407 [Shigella flexneri 1485-80]|nr:hypothetical protein SF148580_4407 [Shigella flexneri 1485-80]
MVGVGRIHHGMAAAHVSARPLPVPAVLPSRRGVPFWR